MPKTLYTEEAKLLQRQLRDARELAGITQAALSEAMGRGQSFISDIERGVRRLDVVELWQLCNALGMDLSSFVGEFQKSVESRPGKRVKRLRRNEGSLPRKRS